MSALRSNLTEKLKAAMHAKDEITVGTIRLIMSAMKDKDIAARSAESRDGIPDEQILALMQGMIKQRHESIKMYVQGGRQELADREAAEIKVIETFLPKQMSEEETKTAIAAAVAATGAASIKDMGKVMAELKAKYTGQMDFSKAGPWVKEKLTGGA